MTEVEEESSASSLADGCADFLVAYRGGLYKNRLIQDVAKGTPVLLIDCYDLISETENKSVRTVSDLITIRPYEAMKVLAEAAKTVLVRHLPAEKQPNITIRFKNAPMEVEIPELRGDEQDNITRPNHVGMLVSTTGIINMLEKATVYLRQPAYRCMDCDNVMYAKIISVMDFLPVVLCSKCKSTDVVQDPTKSSSTTFQRIGLQQLHEKVEDASIAQDIEVWVQGSDMINSVRPGERVRVVGIVRTKPRNKFNKRQQEFYLELSYIQSAQDEEKTEDEAKMEKLVRLAVRPETEEVDFDKLGYSICPSIKGEDVIKRCLLLQLVGSEALILPDGSRLRGDINILMCGDPSTAKSTLMRFVRKIPKRAVYVSGRGWSKAGLTAVVQKDSENSLPRIHPGAYMLADKGLCCVDELEKTNEEDREALPNLMDDQQSFSLNKFSINKEIQIRAASLHACNPAGGKWDEELTFHENLPLAHWLIDRYDLMFVLRNIPDEAKDKGISDHFSDMLLRGVSERVIERKEKAVKHIDNVYGLEYMKAWVAYVKKNFDPVMSTEAMERIKTFYLTLRKKNETKDVTMRQMGALFRLSRASARAHMRNAVTVVDVQLGMELIVESMASCGIDPETGKMNVALIGNAPTSKPINQWIRLRRKVAELSGGDGCYEPFKESEIIEYGKRFIEIGELKMKLATFYHQGKLAIPKDGWYQATDAYWSSSRY